MHEEARKKVQKQCNAFNKLAAQKNSEEHLTMKLFTMYITWRFKVEGSRQL
jgi:hypothetical protein